MSHLICDVITCCVSSFYAIKSMYMIKSRLKTREKRKYGIKEILHKSPSNRWFSNGIRSLLRRADARQSAGIIYSMWRISLLCGSGIVNDVTK